MSRPDGTGERISVVEKVDASGHRSGTLEQALAGADVGTLFLASARRLASRKRWIAFYHRPTGCLVVDEGAKKALTTGGRGCCRTRRGSSPWRRGLPR
jgi:glutamate 5-kinase